MLDIIERCVLAIGLWLVVSIVFYAQYLYMVSSAPETPMWLVLVIATFLIGGASGLTAALYCEWKDRK